jgi:hypothetical protein
LFSSGAGVFLVQTNLDFTFLTPTSKNISVLIFECMQTAQHVMFPPLWEFHICFFTLSFCARAQTQKPPPAFPDQLLAPGIAQSDRFSILNMYIFFAKNMDGNNNRCAPHQGSTHQYFLGHSPSARTKFDRFFPFSSGLGSIDALFPSK